MQWECCIAPFMMLGCFIFICNVLLGCCSFRKLFLTLWCRGCYTLGGHIESVFAVLIWKCGSFLDNGATNSTHFLYMYERMVHSVPMSHAIRVWGIVSFIVVIGLSTTFRLINGNHLHTFCFYTNPPHRRWYGNYLKLLLWRNFLLWLLQHHWCFPARRMK